MNYHLPSPCEIIFIVRISNENLMFGHFCFLRPLILFDNILLPNHYVSSFCLLNLAQQHSREHTLLLGRTNSLFAIHRIIPRHCIPRNSLRYNYCSKASPASSKPQFHDQHYSICISWNSRYSEPCVQRHSSEESSFQYV